MKKRFTLLLNTEVVKEAKKAAIDTEISFSELVERLLIQYIDKKKALSASMPINQQKER